ncbi:MAG: Flp pilus assembly complex ATPase component TadA, partial [Pseudomonadales bacterium]|nr:Flp pilus assembly complex ATPase component TadA [Pseudomonadales bacterium]
TAEDPVEIGLAGINQVNVNPKAGLTFSKALKAFLRQDPDIIMVGEIRDLETAEIAIKAAQTGHMVLSTLHTNDSVSTAMRLIDMGCEPFLVASALKGIVAQRLVKKICEHCKQPYELSVQENIWLESINADKVGVPYFLGSGCHHCNNTGYTGRLGVYELLELDEPMLDALRRGDTAEFSKAAYYNKHFIPLAECALQYASEGITSVQEVFRISSSLEDRVSEAS